MVGLRTRLRGRGHPLPRFVLTALAGPNCTRRGHNSPKQKTRPRLRLLAARPPRMAHMAPSQTITTAGGMLGTISERSFSLRLQFGRAEKAAKGGVTVPAGAHDTPALSKTSGRGYRASNAVFEMTAVTTNRGPHAALKYSAYSDNTDTECTRPVHPFFFFFRTVVFLPKPQRENFNLILRLSVTRFNRPTTTETNFQQVHAGDTVPTYLQRSSGMFTLCSTEETSSVFTARCQHVGHRRNVLLMKTYTLY